MLSIASDSQAQGSRVFISMKKVKASSVARLTGGERRASIRTKKVDDKMGRLLTATELLSLAIEARNL